jgi:hypothetical protein
MSLIRRSSWALVVLFALVSASFGHAQAPGHADLRAWAAAVRSDLRNLIIAQERYFADHVRYAVSIDSLQYRPSAGVEIELTAATPTGWSASARHTGAEFTCVIFVGNAPRPRPDAVEGAPLCEGLPREAFAADSVQRMISQMAPMYGNLVSNMYEGLVNTLARPDVAERLATFTRNYYEALVRHGFTADEALRIVASVGIPALR